MWMKRHVVGQIFSYGKITIITDAKILTIYTIRHQNLTASGGISARGAVDIDYLPQGLVHSLPLEYREQRPSS